MPINTRTATAAIALLIGAGAYPFAATAQTETTEEVEVEVIETENAEQAVEEGAQETGQAIQEGAEQTGQALEEGAQETGQALEEGAQETEQAVEVEGVEETQIDTSAADDLDETQKQELEQAAAEGKPVPRPEMIMGVQKEGQWLSSDLIGREVLNQQDEGIGDIGAILFSDQGPDGVIVEVGGFLGMGEKDVAIKWEELSVSEEGIVVDATEEQLENAPEFVSLEEQRREAELQAQQEAAEAQQTAGGGGTLPATDEQMGQQTETLEPATEDAQ